MFCMVSPESRCQAHYRLVFWNVENFFDIWDDTTRNDDAFTPTGQNHWTKRRYEKKTADLAKAIAAMSHNDGGTIAMPLIVGMAEVENDKVLRDLCQGSPLRRFGYDFVHFDSPDRRGIDVALLYRKGFFHPFHREAVSVSDSAEAFFTRDLLLVEGVTNEDDTLCFLVCHLPSKLGGTTSDKQRAEVARRLRMVMDSVATSHPTGAVVVMGDFNGAPDEEELRIICESRDGRNYVNLMASMEPGKGSYRYQDHWACLDQFIVSPNLTENGRNTIRLVKAKGEVFEADFLLREDEKYLGQKVFRTYLGTNYQGGYSDHLPVFIDLYR